MFSKTCEYAIRAILFIAQKSKQGVKVSIKDVAKGIDSPEFFLGKILQELSRKGIVKSLKGPTGGFYLDDESMQYSLADVVIAIDGDKIFNGCGLGLKQCSEKQPCPIHKEFKKIRSDIFKLLENSKLGEFNDLLDKRLAVLKR
ncbi:RrF2 family transcriptional regulator [Hydrotalea sandarakina]|jgi:Rrf2 family protein|uniref:BadM/Rrf2 family transcriptional regulator n=1 Tax=Hydrotalea sandarakina TaxID=1004304 RepID=A0A2W7SGE7_9BACT|nr:Rrf2 family transcriptional regulator [Hydrotalea sandarakina]PZX65977.1 BadM/Rrf2 family transcriptional regulator [Hydrotalea sandarakina]